MFIYLIISIQKKQAYSLLNSLRDDVSFPFNFIDQLIAITYYFIPLGLDSKSMPERILKIGFLTKLILTALAAILYFVPDSFGREGMKLYSIGNNLVWNSTATWSLSVNGEASGFVPQSNDTVFIECPVIQNISFSFSGNGVLNVSKSGVLRGENSDLSFSGNATLNCNGEIKTNNLGFEENSAFILEGNGNIIVFNSFTNNSFYNHLLFGNLKVTGGLFIGNSVSISGKGVIESSYFNGSGTVLGITPASLIPDGSLISENIWIGNLNNDWYEPMNWAGGILPAENSNISILSSYHNPGISTKVHCNNLFINSGAVLTVFPTASIDIAGNLSVLGSGKCLLKNTVSEKSSLIINGEITGKIQSEYPVVAEQKNLISSPVSIALSGTFLSMYLRPYNEASSQWGDYIVPTDDPLQVMRGYELYSLYSETRIFEGTPNNNAVSFAISNSGNGLNLTGNPFPCYIDWENCYNDSWQGNSIASAIYSPDPSGSGNFSVYLPGGDDAVSLNNGNRYIAPMQGFFVKAGNQGSLTVKESSRVSNISDAKLILKNNSIKLRLNDFEGLSDEVLFRVVSNSSFGFDDEVDAIKIQGNTESPLLYLASDDDVKYAVSSIPTINSSLEIPLSINCSKGGMFRLSTSGSFNFEYRYPVILEDKELSTFIDLRADSVYSFYHSPEMNSGRFKIHFNSTEGVDEIDGFLSEVSVFPGQIRITGTENDVYTANLFTAEGKLIGTSKGILSEGIDIKTGNIPSVICLLELFNGKHSIAKKILTK